MFFRIGEVSRRTGVPAHVLRYWETEFPQLSPRKGGGGQRLYSEADVALVERIRELVHDRGFTVDGARRALRPGRTAEADPLKVAAWREELRAIRNLLRG